MKRSLVLLALAAVPAAAQTVNFRYVAFGDSVTAGSFDESGGGGYPPRLEALLGAAGRQVEMEKSGLGGETTAQGLTRIDSVLAPGDQVLLLMEGTNDVFSDKISVETAHANLLEMAAKAALLGIDTVHLTIIPMKAQGSNAPHPKNPEASELADLVAGSAQAENQGLVDLFDLWTGIADLYENLYAQDENDPVGHPRAAGYERMADDVAAVLLAPLPGAVNPTAPIGDIVTATPDYVWDEAADASWYRLWIKDSAGTSLHKAWYRALGQCAAGSCTVLPPDPLPGSGDYSWTVVPRNPGGWGPETAEQAFTYWDGPPAPTATHLPDGPTFATDPTFVWDEVADATRYFLEVDAVSSGPAHDDWYEAADVCSAGSCSTRAGLALAPGDYLWRVTSSNPAGDAPVSPDRGFEVHSCPVQQDLTVTGPLSGPKLYEACGEITVVDFQVLGDGDAVFLAGVAVVFDNGVEVADGGQMTVYAD